MSTSFEALTIRAGATIDAYAFLSDGNGVILDTAGYTVVFEATGPVSIDVPCGAFVAGLGHPLSVGSELTHTAGSYAVVITFTPPDGAPYPVQTLTGSLTIEPPLEINNAADARSRFATAGEIINRAAAEMGLGEASDPWASSDPNFVQLRRLAQTAGEEILRARDWAHLIKTCSFLTSIGREQYLLPDDYHKMIPQTGWVRDALLPLQGPLSPQQWQYVGIRGEAGALPLSVMFRHSTLEIRVAPTPTSQQTISFEYLSKWWVQSGTAGAPDKDVVTAADDVILFDALLVVHALKAKFLAAKGFDNSVSSAERDLALMGAKSRDASAPILSIAGGRRIGARLLDELNAAIRIGGV